MGQHVPIQLPLLMRDLWIHKSLSVQMTSRSVQLFFSQLAQNIPEIHLCTVCEQCVQIITKFIMHTLHSAEQISYLTVDTNSFTTGMQKDQTTVCCQCNLHVPKMINYVPPTYKSFLQCYDTVSWLTAKDTWPVETPCH